MQIDLHHTGIYVLCRIAGMISEAAEIVAYASQQVDDATHGHALKFENGGAFRQVRTSDKLLSPKNLDVNDALEIWMPFHFLPYDTDIENEESQICRANSRVLELLLESVHECSSSPLGLYRLGIALHSFADTYSHQDFKGFFDRYNMVKLLSGVEVKHDFRKMLDEQVDKHLIDIIPLLAVGHGEVLKNPDIPYAKWSYQRGNKVYPVDNLSERYLPALQDIHSFLSTYLDNNPHIRSGIKPRSFDDLRDKLIHALQYHGTREQRHQKWLELIRSNYFQFKDYNTIDKNLSYDPRAWFREAVEVIPIPLWKKIVAQLINNCNFYRSKPGFDSSQWAKFMHAAAEHQFIVLHKILPTDTVYLNISPNIRYKTFH